VRFRVFRGDIVVGLLGLVVFAAVGAVVTWVAIDIARSLETEEARLILALAGLVDLLAVGVPIYMMRRSLRVGELVIDPDRGELRLGRAYEIPFSKVRRVEVVEHHYAYREINTVHETVTAEMTGWAIDIGDGRRLIGENGLSKERVTEIADALRVRVEAYRARTKEDVAPRPAPSEVLLERIARALKEQGDEFEPDWLDLDGPMAEEIRHFGEEPNESTMGPDGAFARALRKAGYDLGDAGR
jgi:hypothetical protein